MKTIVTVTGIRPDFIRMSAIFKMLDKHFHHVLIHTGQHFNTMLSDVFFDELKIRTPDYNLNIGGVGKEHYHQTAGLTVKLLELFKDKDINPDLVLFLGDSNSVLVAPVLRKEGYTVGHIEAGMRSYDKRMLEEINRICCDHSSHFLFTYHENYKQNLLKENIPESSVYVVGNTIVEVANKLAKPIKKHPKKHTHIVLDIHRPENFKNPQRLANIIEQTKKLAAIYNKPIKMLAFPRTMKYVTEFGIPLKNMDVIDLLSYKSFLRLQYDALFIVSDSGTAQEEPALLQTPVLVPRDFTERPESYQNDCSFIMRATSSRFPISLENNLAEILSWLDDHFKNKRAIKTDWLGCGTTSTQIKNILTEVL